MYSMKRQPSGLLTGSLVFMVLAVVVAVLSGDILLLLAVGSAVAGVMMLSRPSLTRAASHATGGRYEVAEHRRSVQPERVVVHTSGRTFGRSTGRNRPRPRRTASPQNRTYTVIADAALPVIQVLR